jgi:hypothetical protein
MIASGRTATRRKIKLYPEHGGKSRKMQEKTSIF